MKEKAKIMFPALMAMTVGEDWWAHPLHSADVDYSPYSGGNHRPT